jgi:hypothetical protein
MKIEVVQTACPGANGNYDITGTTPSSDMVGALFFGSNALITDNNTGNCRFSFGATDGTHNLCLSMGAANNAAGAGIASQLSTTLCLQTATGSNTGGTTGPLGSFSSFLANGVRLSITGFVVGRLLDTMLFSGTDSQMQCGAQQFAGSDASHVISHGLSGTPDVIILLVSLGQNGTDTIGTGFSIGFWDRTSGAQSSMAYFAVENANPTDQTGYVNSNWAGSIIGDGAFSANVKVQTVGSSSFTIALDSTADNTTKLIGWIAMRGTSAQMSSGNMVATLPMATGNTALITGLPARPQCYIALPTRMTQLNTIAESDAAGSFGASFAGTPDNVTTYQGSSANTFQYNVATSSAHHQISIDRGLVELLNTGATDAVGTLNSWDSGGVTINYSHAAAGSFLCPVLAFGLAPGNVFLPYPLTRTQFFANDTVTYG